MTWRTSNEKIRTALLVLCLFVAAKPAEASVSGGGKLDCEAEFVKVMEDRRYIDLGNKIKRWKALAPQCAGLLAQSLGLSALFPDDHVMLRHGMVMYDAYYA